MTAIWALAIALAIAACGQTAVAQSQFPTNAPASVVPGTAMLIPNGTTSGGQPVMAPVGIANPMPVVALPSNGAGSASGLTVGITSSQALGAAVIGRKFLAIDNESTTATVACAFGAPAAINAAGSFTIPPGFTRTWDGTFVPNDAVSCIASAGATPVTIEVD